MHKKIVSCMLALCLSAGLALSADIPSSANDGLDAKTTDVQETDENEPDADESDMDKDAADKLLSEEEVQEPDNDVEEADTDKKVKSLQTEDDGLNATALSLGENEDELEAQSEVMHFLGNEAGFYIGAPLGELPYSFYESLILDTEELNDEEMEMRVQNAVGDQQAQVKLYEVEITSSLSDDDVKQYGESVRAILEAWSPDLYIPVPEGWDRAWLTGCFVQRDGISMSSSVEIIDEEFDEDYYLKIPLQNDSLENNDTTKLYGIYAAVENSVPTEVKDWDTVVDDYITTIRFMDWSIGEHLSTHFFTETPPANDVVAVTRTAHISGKYNTTGEYWNPEDNEVQIPYDVFVTDAKEFFANVPDLTGVNDPNFMYYDASSNTMNIPAGGGGDMPLVTELVKAKELGDGIYALQFKVSKNTIEVGDNNELIYPDMEDESQYYKCTLTVEDNGSGHWRYLSFVEGYTETLPQKPSTGDQETPKPGTPGTNQGNTGEGTAQGNQTAGNNTVNTNASAVKAARTGDTANIGLYLILFAGAGAAMLLAFRKRKA